MLKKPTLALSKIAFLAIMLITVFGCEDQTIESYIVDLHKRGKFNGVVLIGTAEGISYSRAYGFENHTQQSLLTTQHRFQVGSIYKEFPGVAIMQLVERNKLSLTKPISVYLEDLPDWSKRVTAKHLLTYSSGLPTIPWSDLFQKGTPVSKIEVLRELSDLSTLTFEPGKSYLYSNYNPILLIQIVEQVSGMSFEEYCRKYIFMPANMKTAMFAEKFPYQGIYSIASPFNTENEPDNYKFNVSELLINVSSEDIYSWLKYLHLTKPLSKDSMHQLTESMGEQSALGIVQWKDGEIYHHHHHGSSGNFEATVRYVSANETFIVILTNQNNGNVSDIADKFESLIREGTNT
jgi:CubicO group peptidase (beta-lactamase class C family)